MDTHITHTDTYINDPFKEWIVSVCFDGREECSLTLVKEMSFFTFHEDLNGKHSLNMVTVTT